MSKKDYGDAKTLQAEYAKEKVENSEMFQALELDDETAFVERICYDVDNDITARKEYLDKVIEILDLYEGKVQKQPLFNGAANVSTRIVTMVVEVLHSILFPAVWNEDLHAWYATESENIPDAETVSKLMKWDCSHNKMKLFISDWVKWLVLEGTVVTKTRWDESWKWTQQKKITEKSLGDTVKKVIKDLVKGGQESTTVNPTVVEYVPKKIEKAKTEIIPLEDVGFPSYVSPSMEEEDLDHIWHRTRPYIYDIQELEDRGFYKEGVTDTLASRMEERFTAERNSTTSQRMDAEGSKLLDIKKECSPLEIIEWYGKYKTPQGYQEVVGWIEKHSKTYLGGTYLRCIDKFEKRPFHISQLIRRMSRMYGISMGEIVKEFQKILDEMQNQNLNAGKLATMPPGFYRAASGYDPEKVVLQPGIMIPVDDINDVKWLQIPATTLPSHEEMRLVLDMVEKIASIGSYQSGQESNIVKTRATARGTMAIIQQGERRFFVLGMGLQSHLSQIMEDRLRYYQQYISDDMAERIVGQDGAKLFKEGLDQGMIAGEFNVVMGLDSTGGSKSQKVEIANAIYQTYIQNPFTQQDPARVWEVSARPLKENGEIDVESIIGPKPQPKTPEDIQAQQKAQQAALQQQALLAQGGQVLDQGKAPGAPSGQATPPS